MAWLNVFGNVMFGLARAPGLTAERRREIERSQAQQAEFYRRETEQQEARQNAEAAQRLGLRSRG